MLAIIGCIIFCISLVVSDALERRRKNELFQKELLEIKKREETDVVFRYRNIPDELLADHYIMAEYNNDTDYMEDMKKVMMERSKKASFEEAYEYYYKIFDEWRSTTNFGCF